MDQRQELDRLRKLKRLQELEARAAVAPARETPSARTNLGALATQGATLGFGDELASGLLAGTVGTVKGVARAVQQRDLNQIPQAIGQEFVDNQRYQAGERQATRERFPVTSAAAEIGGGIIGSAATGGAAIAAGRTLAGQAARGAAVGGAQGAIAGAGYTDGSLKERAEGAGVGASIGATLGAAAPLITNQVAKFWRARATGARVPEELKRSYNSLIRVLEDDLGSRGKAEAAVRKFVKSNSDGDILDIAGGKTLSRLREIATRNPESALGFVDEVREGATRDVRKAVAGSINTRGGTMRTSTEALKLSRQQQAGPLFRAAEQTRVPDGFVDDLIAERPAVRAATQRAARELANSQELTPFNVLKVAKENLDDQVSGLFRAGKTAEARRVQVARDELRNRLTQLSPEYRQALDIWSGSKAADDALAKGAQFLKPSYSAEDLASDISSMSKSEREFYRVAVAEQFEDAISNTKDGLSAPRRFATPAIRDKVRALFADNPDDAEAFVRILKRAETRIRSANTIDPFLGSQTQPRQVAAADFLAEASGPITRSANTITQGIASPTQIPQRAVTAIAGQRGEAQAQRVSEILADALFERNTTALQTPRTVTPPSQLAGASSPALIAPAQNRE